MLESPFNKIAFLKAGYFILKRLQQRCFPMNIAKFLGTPILKNICKQLLLYILSLNQRSEKWKIHKSDDLISGIFRSSPSEVLKKILVLNIFSNSKKMYLVKFTSVQKVLEHLWMATSGDSDDKILLFNNTPESNRMRF